MSEDTLKALLLVDEPAAPPARDLGFTVAVMQKIERRRLVEGIILCTAVFTILAALLALVMPHVTPALVTLGQAVMPALIALFSLAMVAFGLFMARPAFREFGIRL